MDGRDCAKCQNSGKRDISGILEFVNDNKTNVNSCLLQKLKETNAVGWDVWDVVAEAFGFLGSLHYVADFYPNLRILIKPLFQRLKKKTNP